MKTLSRRTFLRGTGAALALPWLEAMQPAFGQDKVQSPRRFLGVCTNLGVLERNFLPATTGRDFQLTPYLKLLEPYRENFTVVSGTSHPDSGDHLAEVAFFTAAKFPGTSSFKNTISIDQVVAEKMGHHTRFPSLPLAVIRGGNQSLSVTQSGVMIPAETSPAKLYETLFVQGNAQAVERQIAALRSGRSILDTVTERANGLRRELGAGDRDRVDQYFTSVRDLEQRLLRAEEWENKPKPKTELPKPQDTEFLLERLGAMYDLIHLALATDSTRAISLMIKLDGFTGKIPGVQDEPHNLSHHGERPEKIAQLAALETAQFTLLAKLLEKLSTSKEQGKTLLDQTSLFYGSNIADGSSHAWHNLPILLAGGGFKHGQHLAFDRKNNTPLSNLFLSVLQRLGIEANTFGSSTGTLRGLEMA